MSIVLSRYNTGVYVSPTGLIVYSDRIGTLINVYTGGRYTNRVGPADIIRLSGMFTIHDDMSSLKISSCPVSRYISNVDHISQEQLDAIEDMLCGCMY